MQKEEKETPQREKRKPYQKPALTAEELFEATVLGCGKGPTGPTCARNKKTS